jgi:hypothetical protein
MSKPASLSGGDGFALNPMECGNKAGNANMGTAVVPCCTSNWPQNREINCIDELGCNGTEMNAKPALWLP